MKCKNCGKELTGRQTMFCSVDCKQKYYQQQGYHTKYSRKKDYHGTLIKYYLIQQRGGKCERCGYDKNLSALEFHHIDPNTKEFTLDARTLERHSDEEINTEFNKCILLCANCHSEQHHPDLNMSNINNIKEYCKGIKYRKLHKVIELL